MEDGIRANAMLKQNSLQNPLKITSAKEQLTKEEKVKIIKEHFTVILDTLGLDTEDPAIKDTPKRVAEMYVNELFSGLLSETFPKITFFESTSSNVTHQNIPYFSICEHHFMPFRGTVSIQYVSKAKVLGLSKLNRIVTYLASRPQIQERFTQQLLLIFTRMLETPDVLVIVKGTHLCIEARGVCQTGSETITRAGSGVFAASSKL